MFCQMIFVVMEMVIGNDSPRQTPSGGKNSRFACRYSATATGCGKPEFFLSGFTSARGPS